MRLFKNAVVLLFIYAFLAGSLDRAFGQDYNDVGTVSGHVEIEDHPSLGKTPCRNCEFLIQRLDCRRSLVDVKTDGNGDYSFRVGLGKWRIIMTERREGSNQTIDLLSHNQPRTFEVKSPLEKLVFNIMTVTLP